MDALDGGCLAHEAVHGFVSGTLADDEAERVEDHLDGCADCRALVAVLARGSDTILPTRAEPGGLDTTAALGSGETGLPGMRAAVSRSAGHPPTGTQIDRYVIERPLGAGAMGAVSLADDPELKRKVCVKLLRPQLLDSGDTQATRARLQREAQAMAQVSHPNVVAVYDIGTYEGQVFIAMEYVEGGDLSRWLREEERRPAEVLEVFRAAGRGLAAAHRAGLIHRDFKPQNVMVGKDGSIKVTDFGLARADAETDRREPGEADAGREAKTGDEADSLLASPLTRTGAMIGTPAYMAPEQVRGEEIDARCDQFAFAVALYEALFGVRPFAGAGLEEIHAAAVAERVVPPPRRSGVPRRMRAAIVRGLRASPDNRFPTMDAMLAALAPRSWRRAFIAASAGAILLSGGLAAAGIRTGTDDAPVCDGGAALIAPVWDDAARGRIRSAFAATGLVLAKSSSASVVGELDEYAGQWIAAHREACAATRVRQEQTEDMLALRMACLDRRRAELAATVQVLERPDAAMVDNAFQIPSNLSSIADCADARALAAPLPLPRDARTREQIAATRAKLARADALVHAQRLDKARALVEQVVGEAAGIGWSPLVAEARFKAAQLDLLQLRFDDAEKGFDAAVVAAEQAGHDDIRIEAYFGQTGIAKQRGRPDQALRWAGYARAAIERTGSRPGKLASLATTLGDIYAYQGDGKRAIAEYQRAIELDTRAFGARSSEVATATYRLAAFYHQLREHDRAIAGFEKAFALYTQVEVGGADHPLALFTLKTMSSVRQEQDRGPEALALAERALAGFRRVYGDDHEATGAAHYALGLAQGAVGRIDDGLASQERAIAIWRRVLGPKSPYLAAFIGGLAITLNQAERYEQSAARVVEAIDIYLAGGQPEASREIIQFRNMLATIFTRLKRYDDALAQVKLSLASAEKILAPDAQQLADTLTVYGFAHNRKGDARHALPLLERAFKVRQAGKAGASDSSWTKLELARALWDAPGDRARARRLAEESLAEARSVEQKEGIEAAEEWLASHGARGKRPARPD